jgi:hypothetical protein
MKTLLMFSQDFIPVLPMHKKETMLKAKGQTAIFVTLLSLVGLTVVNMNIAVFMDCMLHDLIKNFLNFSEACCLLLLHTLKMGQKIC